MSANFTPIFGGYREPGAFRFWCQKVIPLVYDDSLSYYELLCKVVDYINNLVHDNSATIDNVNALLTAYNQLQDYVNNYFANLDITSEVSDKIDQMADDGTLLEILEPVTTELTQYIREQAEEQQLYNQQTRSTVTSAIDAQNEYNAATRSSMNSALAEQNEYNASTRSTVNSAIDAQNAYNTRTREIAEAMVGHPFTANSSAAMTDQSKVYVYTGTTSGNYVNGHWYYYNGGWIDGGIYNSQGLSTDKGLTLEDNAGDARYTGLRLNDITTPFTWRTNIRHSTNNGAESSSNGWYSTTKFTVVDITKIVGASRICVATVSSVNHITGYIHLYEAGTDTYIGFCFYNNGTLSFQSANEDYSSLPSGKVDAYIDIRSTDWYAVFADSWTNAIRMVKVQTDPYLNTMGVPADSKVTGDEISGLKSDLTRYTGITPITWTDNGYISLTGTTVDIEHPTSNNTWEYAVVSCSEGDRFEINAAGGVSPRAYGFIDASNKVLVMALASATITNYVAIAPQNSTYLILNNKKEAASKDFISYKNQFLTDRIEKVEDYVGTDVSLLFLINANIPLGNYSIGDVVSLTPEAVQTYRYCITGCIEGDSFLLNCVGGSNPRAWAFLDSNNRLLSVANANATISNLYLVAPQNAAKLIINDAKSGGDCKRLGRLSETEYKISDVANAVDYLPVKTKRELIQPIAEDVVSSYVRGYEFADDLVTPLMDFAKPGDLMVHVSTFAIINGVVYCTYYANTRSAQEKPTEHTARFAIATLSDPTDMAWYDLQDIGDTYDGKTVNAIYDTILMQKDSNTLVLMWTAMLGTVYYRLYQTYTISTGVFSAIQYNNFYNGSTGGVWNTTNMASALSGIDHKPISGDIGIMQKLSSRVESGATWYYTGAYAGNFNCIIKSQDLITWYYVATPDFDNDSEFENATYVLNNKVFYFVRQTSNNNTGFLTYYDLTTGEWAEPVFINDCQSRSDFLNFGGTLYLFHAPKDRNHIGMLYINQNAINRSVEFKTAKVPDYFYPYTLIYNDQAYMSVTASRQHIYLFRFTLIGKSNDTIINMFKTALT